MPALNAAWHLLNKMPENASDAQRMKWHLSHARACGCREIPKTVMVLLRAKGIQPPPRHGSSVRLASDDRDDPTNR